MSNIRLKGTAESSARGRGRTRIHLETPVCCGQKALRMRHNKECYFKCLRCKRETEKCSSFEKAKEKWKEMFDG